MKLWDLIKIANRNLTRSRLRTILTVMAIFVGSFTLTMTNGLGDGLRDYVENQVKNIEGNKILFVRKKFEAEASGADSGAPQEYKETTQDEAGNVIDPNAMTLSPAQIEAAVGEIADVKSVTPFYRMDGEYITLDGAKKYQLSLGMLSEGVTQKTEAGSTIDGEGQILLPLAQAQAFDRNIENLIGKTATIAYKTDQTGALKTLDLRIVGVATKGFMANYNTFVDAQTARQIYDDQNRQSNYYNQFQSYTVQLDTSDAARIEAIKTQLEEKGLAAETIADQKKRTYDAIGIFQAGMNLLAFVALLAAAFGIINTLVIAVLERTKEIGLQKALGMGRGRIFTLFALESVLIGFWGACSGIVAAIGVGVFANLFLVRSLLESFEGYSLFVFTMPSILFVLLLVCLIAFAAGVFPAWRASRLHPIEALRYE